MADKHHKFLFLRARVASVCIVAVLLAFSTPSAASPSTGAPERNAVFNVVAETRTPALVNASVDLWVGSTVFLGNTDGQGRMKIDIACGDDDDLVYAIVRGTGGQQGIDMARIMNACGTMKSESQASGHFQAGPINPVSTAFFAITRWFVRRHQEYKWPISAVELTEVRHLLGGLHVAYIASAIDYWAAGLGSRPPGIASSLELVLDKSALMRFVTHVEETVDIDSLRSLLLRTRWDLVQFRRPQQFDKPAVALTSCSELQRSCDDLFELYPDKTGQFSSKVFSGLGNWLDLSRGDVIFADALQFTAGNLRALQFDSLPGQPLSFSETQRFIEVPGEGFVQTPFRREFTRAYLRVIDASDIVPMLGIQNRWREFYPEFPELGVTQFAGQFSSILNGLLNWNDRPHWEGPAPGQMWALPLLKLEDDYQFSPFTQTLIQFSGAGAALLLDTGELASWSFSEQVLTIDSPTLGPHRYYFLGGLPSRHQMMVVVVDAQPGDTALRRTVTVATIPTTLEPDWEAAGVSGRYVGGFGFDNWLPSNYANPEGFFVLDLNPDGTGQSGSVENLYAPLTGVPLTWRLDDQLRLEIARDFKSVKQWRRWQLLSAVPDSKDLYVLEATPIMVDSGQQAIEFREQRIQFYRRLDLP